jgi:hypothetical protein
MESANDVVKAINNDKDGFFKTVFNFNDDSKKEMLNIIQYLILSIIPCVLILKTVRYTMPEEDESKGSLEILAEILGQVTFLILAMYFSNKAIRYIPTYSGVNYVTSQDELSFLLPFMILLLTMQTKIGLKVNILFDRALDLWYGKNEDAKISQGKNNIRVTQPLSGQYNPSQADNDNMNLLPTNTSMTTQIPTMNPQQSPDFNSMYQSQNTPMPGAQQPGIEPMAANEMGGFSSW